MDCADRRRCANRERLRPADSHLTAVAGSSSGRNRCNSAEPAILHNPLEYHDRPRCHRFRGGHDPEHGDCSEIHRRRCNATGRFSRGGRTDRCHRNTTRNDGQLDSSGGISHLRVCGVFSFTPRFESRDWVALSGNVRTASSDLSPSSSIFAKRSANPCICPANWFKALSRAYETR